MSADEVYLRFVKFEDAPPSGCSPGPGGSCFEWGYYWWQSDADDHNGVNYNEWATQEARDAELAAAGGVIGWLNRPEGDSALQNAIFDAIDANAGFHAGEAGYVPRCYLYVNGSTLNLQQVETEHGHVLAPLEGTQ